MSITVNIYYKGKNGSAREFVRKMKESGIVDEVRKEDGNERYEYFFSDEDPETVLLIDRWRDQSALDLHHSLPLMGKIAALRDKYDLEMIVERFDGDGAMPEKDEKYIARRR